MIFFNPQLMPDRESALLYMAHNPIPFENYEDHEAALYIQLHELVERSMEEGEDPVALIENYLDVHYNDGRSPDEITAFLIYQDKMVYALDALKQHWKTMDSTTTTSENIQFGGLSQHAYMELFGELTLRTYIEVLATLQY